MEGDWGMGGSHNLACTDEKDFEPFGESQSDQLCPSLQAGAEGCALPVPASSPTGQTQLHTQQSHFKESVGLAWYTSQALETGRLSDAKSQGEQGICRD